MEELSTLKKVLTFITPVITAVVLIAILPTYFNLFVAWQELGKYFILMVIISLLIGALGFSASSAKENKTKKSVIVGTVAAFLSTILTISIILFLLNNIIFEQTQNIKAASIIYVLVFIIMAVCLFVFCIRSVKNCGKAPAAITIAALALYVVAVGVNAVTFEKAVTPTEIVRTEEDFNRDGILIGGYGMTNIPEGNVSVDDQVKRAVNAGIDFIVTGNKSKEFLDACDKYGLGVILVGTDLLPHGAVNDDTYEKWMTLTRDDFYNFEVDGDKIYAHECIWGVDVTDEPNSNNFNYLADMTAHFKEVLPEKFAFVNLFPIFASSTQLQEPPFNILSWSPVSSANKPYINHINKYSQKMSTDYISFDIYPLSAERTHEFDYTAWINNLDILSKNCNASNRDLWIYIQSCGEAQANSGSTARRYASQEDILWQSYVSLSFGTDTIIHACYMGGWFDAYDHSINPDGDMTDTYTYVKNANKQIKAFSDVYADYINKGAFTLNISDFANLNDGDLTPVDEQYKPENVTSKDPLLVGCFNADKGNAYTFVNMYDPLENKTAEFTAAFEEDKTVTIYRKGEKTVLDSSTLAMTLDAGEGIFVTVE